MYEDEDDMGMLAEESDDDFDDLAEESDDDFMDLAEDSDDDFMDLAEDDYSDDELAEFDDDFMEFAQKADKQHPGIWDSLSQMKSDDFQEQFQKAYLDEINKEVADGTAYQEWEST